MGAGPCRATAAEVAEAAALGIGDSAASSAPQAKPGYRPTGWPSIRQAGTGVGAAARSCPHTKLRPNGPGRGRSAFRKRVAAPTQENEGRWRLCGMRATSGRRQPRCWPFQRRRKVSFKGTVRVHEFHRILDGGDTIPADGTLVSLGLGRLARTISARLAPPAPVRGPGRLPVEETAWVPAAQRIKLLRKTMGDASFFQRWARHRTETRRMRRDREETRRDEKDKTTMPVSMADARDRALRLSRETMASSRLIVASSTDLKAKAMVASAALAKKRPPCSPGSRGAAVKESRKRRLTDCRRQGIPVKARRVCGKAAVYACARPLGHFEVLPANDAGRTRCHKCQQPIAGRFPGELVCVCTIDLARAAATAATGSPSTAQALAVR